MNHRPALHPGVHQPLQRPANLGLIQPVRLIPGLQPERRASFNFVHDGVIAVFQRGQHDLPIPALGIADCINGGCNPPLLRIMEKPGHGRAIDRIRRIKPVQQHQIPHMEHPGI